MAPFGPFIDMYDITEWERMMEDVAARLEPIIMMDTENDNESKQAEDRLLPSDRIKIPRMMNRIDIPRVWTIRRLTVISNVDIASI